MSSSSIDSTTTGATPRDRLQNGPSYSRTGAAQNRPPLLDYIMVHMNLSSIQAIHSARCSHLGEHKGSGLAVMCELLAGALLSGLTNQTTNPPPRGLTNNMLAILIDPARFGAPATIRGEIDAILAHVKGSPPIDPAKPVLVAGEPERATKALRKAEGIPFDERTWRDIPAAAQSVGAPPPVEAW